MKTVAIITVLVLSSAGAAADIYSWTDADGVKHYSYAEPKYPAVPIERSYEFPASIELPQKSPSYSSVYISRWYRAPHHEAIATWAEALTG